VTTDALALALGQLSSRVEALHTDVRTIRDDLAGRVDEIDKRVDTLEDDATAGDAIREFARTLGRCTAALIATVVAVVTALSALGVFG
jgi:hypothetical protein